MKKLLSFFLLISSLNLLSHEFNPAHLIIDQSDTNQNSYDAIWMYPFKNIGKRADVIFPDTCTPTGSDPFVQGKYIIEKITLECTENIKGRFIEIVNLSVLTDALVTINFNDDTFEGLINVQKNKIEIPLVEQYYPTAYLYLGVGHLFDGLDHILFIFGLLFCISGLVNIIKTITAFTVAHSITLGLSVYDIIYLPQGTVEALIALTIVYLALEINDSDKQLKTPWLMAFSFGLLHGLGFAGALSDIGIASDQILLSLLFFNVGIELAQIALIPIPLILIYAASKINFQNYLQITASLCIGGMGFYWFIDRVIGIIL
ncbi:HupE/UreJ family protein [Gammaproteobacteria bacterium]|jgi:hydrogenase/urease accessory protein HupE|nr:HupE/UreJ family protein [Gammaproteobacteria bacterium]MDC0347829.1 HupE/UreJ family protein [Gammaproteobacteria bacterium]